MGIFSEQVKIRNIAEGLTTLVMPTRVKDVITISGSMLGGSLHTTTKNHKIPSITAAMLDKGTELKDKYIINADGMSGELFVMPNKLHPDNMDMENIVTD